MKIYVLFLFSIIFSTLTACSSSAINNKNLPQTLTTSKWQLSSLENTKQITTIRPITLHFMLSNKQFSGYGGCNNFSGTFAVSAKVLVFGPTRSTRMHCRRTSNQEASLFKVLSDEKKYIVNNDELKIYATGGELLATFIKQNLQ